MWSLALGSSYSELNAEHWDQLAGEANPFVSHGFLSALEDSGCIGGETSWLPRPALLFRSGESEPVAAAPTFLKLDSTGEYIFDYNWADAYQRSLGLSYYPKLQVAVPFSPVPGPRLLLHPKLEPAERLEASKALLGGLLQVTDQNELSSLHLTFTLENEASLACDGLPFLHRLGEQYHWFNRGYGSFDDFLATLSSRKRKAIKRERRIAASHPVSYHRFEGEEITDEHWDIFYRMYRTTAEQKWGRPYLNRDFFGKLSRRLGSRVVLFLVRKEPQGSWMAGAWNLRGEDTLYGRNWGCLESFDMLHFEVCYYRAIEYAIERGLSKVEAGAQGFHKIQRGYEPVGIHSAHYIRDPGFAQAVSNFLQQERAEELQRLSCLQEMTPFRKEVG